MSEPWTPDSAPPGRDAACSPVTLIEGSTFCVSEPGGDIRPDRPQGLFVRDTRVLSRWELTIDGLPAQPLTVQSAEPYSAAFIGRMPPRQARGRRRQHPGGRDAHSEDRKHHRQSSGPKSAIERDRQRSVY